MGAATTVATTTTTTTPPRTMTCAMVAPTRAVSELPPPLLGCAGCVVKPFRHSNRPKNTKIGI